MRGALSAAALHLACAAAASGQVQTFPNDYPGFLQAAGAVSTIDFETLPDGSPSYAGASITDTFNYDLQGAHFSAPVHTPFIAGNSSGGYELEVNEFAQRTWIIADMTLPARAVGTFFAGGTRLCAFDASGAQLGCASYQSSAGGLFFVGIVSQTPIVRISQDRGSTIEGTASFVFSPVPEPGTAALLGLGGALATLRRRRAARRPGLQRSGR